ncbi:glycosyltransferase family 4 protein [Lacibacter sediminis]|uniref:Glycosyltransferase family 4 protein n=1 Tax=Lacibacter sediminis TaxID=2760713 RepID=A0A7G5XHQ9_9BACT|nr:glycosyltransferase family 4 protein [Lacibacter sediminis]QNA45012.1 glycosyltransferase family 4 protein [Lacibacter sediminis]
MKKIAIITTHPIQYHAPLFRLLTERKRIALKVFYTWGQSQDAVFDVRFGMKRSWDIPLLDGYEYEFVKNISKHPDSNRFFGVRNPGLINQLKQEKFDVIIVYRWSLFSHLRILRSFGSGTKLFFRGDSHLQKSEKWFKRLLKTILLRYVYKKVDYAFYVGEQNRAYYLQVGLTEKQLRYTPHAIDNERFAIDADEWELKANIERAALSIPQNSVVFLYAGKFYEIKQLELLINAFRQLKADDYRLLLIGNGEQEKQLITLAANDHRIHFQPFRNQSEMPLVYRMGDVFILPSKSETWGLAVNEAMACGRPAIVSDACGCAPELIIEGETGFVFRSGDSNDLLQQMIKFSSIAVARRQGNNALLHIQHFSLERVAEVIEQAVLETTTQEK